MQGIDDGQTSSFRGSKDVLADPAAPEPEDELTTITLTMSDLPAVLRITGSRHGTYMLKTSRSGEGVIMEKLEEKP